MVYIRAEVEIRPTEDENKVIKALKNVVLTDNVRIVEAGRGYKIAIAESSDLTTLLKLYELLRRQRILDTARNVMLKNSRNGILTLQLNKQAAYQGVISFVDSELESQLGAITITITSDKLSEIIDWLAPRTAHGRPLWEREVPKDA